MGAQYIMAYICCRPPKDERLQRSRDLNVKDQQKFNSAVAEHVATIKGMLDARLANERETRPWDGVYDQREADYLTRIAEELGVNTGGAVGCSASGCSEKCKAQSMWEFTRQGHDFALRELVMAHLERRHCEA